MENPLLERTTEALLTDYTWPLQIIILEQHPGGATWPHYHILPVLPTRHQILICQSSKARIAAFTTEGEAFNAISQPNDLLLMLEGHHEVEFLEPSTGFIEVKQDPFPRTDADDNVDLHVRSM
jgi:hypothetical protein